MPFFYKPENGYAGDFIPLYAENEFKLYYMHDYRDEEKYGEGFPWYLITTNDFIDYKEYGEVMYRGQKDEQDLSVLAGSFIKVDDVYHLFYTGHNSHFPEKGKPQEATMHAVSTDLLNWQKIPEDTFYAREDLYERDDWRDPYVFFNEDAKEYWMLLSARLKKGPSRRRGCTVLCTSTDLKKWKVCEPFWAPNLYYMNEAHEIFKMGDWWYLIYSSFSERFVTHYRMSRTLDGPWIAPYNDTFDGRAYYGVKTCSDGNKRYCFAWNGTRDKEKDYNTWGWGGNLVVHEILQNTDGSLSVKVPDSVDNFFKKKLPSSFSSGMKKSKIEEDKIIMNVPDSYEFAVAGDIPACCKISADIKFKENTKGCGIMLRISEDLDSAYYIRLEPVSNRLVFDAWPRKTGSMFPYYTSECPYMIELERPIKLVPGTSYKIKVFVEDTICEVYLNDEIVMSTRMYNLKNGKWGVFAREGEVEFTNINIQIPE